MVTVAGINNKEIRFYDPDDFTILQVKEDIYEYFNKELEIKRMELTCDGTPLRNDQKLSEIVREEKKELLLKQEKVNLDQLSTIDAYQSFDEISCQN